MVELTVLERVCVSFESVYVVREMREFLEIYELVLLVFMVLVIGGHGL